MTDLTVDPPVVPRSRLALLLLILLGLCGLASMAFAPVEQLLPPGVHVSRAAILMPPALIVIACAALGWWAAPKLGLGAPILSGLSAGGHSGRAFHRMLLPAVAGAAVGGLCIALFDATAGNLLNGRAQAIELPLVTRIIYGGTVEEIVFRWTLLSVVALGLSKLRIASGASLWIANVVTALLFAGGHVPNIMMAVAHPPGWLPVAVVLGNLIPALIFGWLFLRRGFESAMIAHGLSHLFSVPLMALLA